MLVLAVLLHTFDVKSAGMTKLRIIVSLLHGIYELFTSNLLIV
jgi:hypothetical protein